MIIRSKAPLRLGLAGGGTDVSPYCDKYGGAILNVTIDMYAYCTIEPTNDGRIEFYASDLKQEFSCKSMTKLKIDDCLILHKGIYNRIVSDYNKGKPLSFKMTTYSDAPVGSGLGSSSTMVVAILKAFTEWLNLPLGEYEMAQLAYNIERKDLQLSGGKQDQYAATFGGLNYMEFYDNDRVIVNPLKIKRWIKNELENELILYFTGTSRDSGRIIEDQIKTTTGDNKKPLEAMHKLKDNAFQMKNEILMGHFLNVSCCLNEGWKAKKETSKVISNKKINEIYNFIIKNGGRAAKISGAGGGGFMMILCDPIKRYDLIQDLNTLDGKVVTVSFTDRGCQAWTLYEE